MSVPKPDFSTDFSGPYPRARTIPKRPNAPPPGSDDAPDAASTEEKKPDPIVSVTTAERSHLWWEETTTVPDAFRKLLSEYAHIPPEEVDEHVVKIVSSTPRVPHLPRSKSPAS